MTNKWFTNWTDEPFTYTWNSEPWTFAVGDSKLLPGYLADHFAKHLTDKVLHEQEKNTNDHTRASLLEKCFAVPEGEDAPAETESDVKAEVEALNSKKKKTKKKTGKKKLERTKEDEEFDGLNVKESKEAL